MFGKYFRKKKAHSLSREASDLRRAGDLEGAAKKYAAEASIDLPDNTLIFADDCLQAFENFLKAGKIDDALAQARRALEGYVVDEWLDNAEYRKNLTDAVAKLYESGYHKEADIFLADINAALAKANLPPETVAYLGGDRTFPDLCPHCSAAVTYTGKLAEIECPFCGGMIHALA